MALDPDTPEWLVLRTSPEPPHVRVHFPDGEEAKYPVLAEAQAKGHRFTLARAQSEARKLGASWVVNHFHTLVTPPEHEAWLKYGKRTNWAP